MRREIGSDFHISDSAIYKPNRDSVIEYLSEYNTRYFDSGRSALRAVLEFVPHDKVLLPAYICESVRACFPDSEVDYYAVDQNFNIVWSDLLSKAECGVDIVYIHYFNGKILPEYEFDKLIRLHDNYGFCIIEDTTHSFLSRKQTVGDFCICSLRKWFPISDGGVLYSKNQLPALEYHNATWTEMKRSAMCSKALYLAGENINKDLFLEVFANAEDELDHQEEICLISNNSFEVLHRFDLKEIACLRKNNFATLSNLLTSLEMVVVDADGMDQVPLFCILKTDNRDSLRKFLIEHKVYCPMHWPLYDELKAMDSVRTLQEKELSIPIDQRYGQAQMEHIAKLILQWEACETQRRQNQ